MIKTYKYIELNDSEGNKKRVKLEKEVQSDKFFVHNCIRFLEAPMGKYHHSYTMPTINSLTYITKRVDDGCCCITVILHEIYEGCHNTIEITKRIIFLDDHSQKCRYGTICSDYWDCPVPSGHFNYFKVFAFDMLRRALVEWMHRPGNPGARAAREHFNQYITNKD